MRNPSAGIPLLMGVALAVSTLSAVTAGAASRRSPVTPDIRLNQLGFYGPAPKSAAVVGSASDNFFVLSPNLADTLFRGKLGDGAIWDPIKDPTAPATRKDTVRIADFSAFTQAGRFVLAVPGLGESHPFTIGTAPQFELAKGSIRAFYYQRASMILENAYAGKWARPAGHPDRRVAVHSSAATAARPAESIVSSPGGWYDAGDYNKYVVNSGITTYTLLSLYRNFSSFYDTLDLNIPESGNNLPDLLDEVLWNLRWMMTMQDTDGGVFHKLTTANFSGSVMPAADTQKRYVVQKSVTAALDLAATAAYASRVFRKFEAQLPGFADSALSVSRKAWDWARANPAALYRQTAMNAAHSPPIVTGEYGDASAADELQWAGVELYLATKIDSFYTAAFPGGALPIRVSPPGWPNVGTLAFYSMSDEGGPDFPLIDVAAVRQRLREAAALVQEVAAKTAFRVPMQGRDFYWGSNSVCANMGMLLIQAYRATGDAAMLGNAVDALDYLLGRNGPSISFVTGFGPKSAMNPHHRPSEADGISEPVPGFLVGGPNTGQQDKSAACVYPSLLPALSYVDAQCSYASNEVAINWNAPLAFLSGALYALYSGSVAPQSIGPADRPSGRRAALLTWEGGSPRLVMPEGLAGRLEFFDGRGRIWVPGRHRDSAGVGAVRPGLLFFRLQVEGKGRTAARTGSWATYSSLRIPL